MDLRANGSLTVEDYFKLQEVGVLGEKVELIEGRIVMGPWQLAFSPAQRAYAAELGITLPDDEQPPEGINR